MTAAAAAQNTIQQYHVNVSDDNVISSLYGPIASFFFTPFKWRHYSSIPLDDIIWNTSNGVNSQPSCRSCRCFCVRLLFLTKFLLFGAITISNLQIRPQSEANNHINNAHILSHIYNYPPDINMSQLLLDPPSSPPLVSIETSLRQ